MAEQGALLADLALLQAELPAGPKAVAAAAAQQQLLAACWTPAEGAGGAVVPGAAAAWTPPAPGGQAACWAEAGVQASCPVVAGLAAHVQHWAGQEAAGLRAAAQWRPVAPGLHGER